MTWFQFSTMRPLRLHPPAREWYRKSPGDISEFGIWFAAAALHSAPGIWNRWLFGHIGRHRGRSGWLQNSPSATNGSLGTNQAQTLLASYSEDTVAAQDYFLQLPMARLLTVL